MLICLEGLDKTGKSTISEKLKKSGFEFIHFSAPRKGISSDEYLKEVMEIIASTSGKDVVLDRSHFGELVWPFVYGRPRKLNRKDFDIIERRINFIHDDYRKVLLYDDNEDAHKKRLLEYNEISFDYKLATLLFETLVEDYEFEKMTFTQAMAFTQAMEETWI